MKNTLYTAMQYEQLKNIWMWNILHSGLALQVVTPMMPYGTWLSHGLRGRTDYGGIIVECVVKRAVTYIRTYIRDKSFKMDRINLVCLNHRNDTSKWMWCQCMLQCNCPWLAPVGSQLAMCITEVIHRYLVVESGSVMAKALLIWEWDILAQVIRTQCKSMHNGIITLFQSSSFSFASFYSATCSAQKHWRVE